MNSNNIQKSGQSPEVKEEKTYSEIRKNISGFALFEWSYPAVEEIKNIS